MAISYTKTGASRHIILSPVPDQRNIQSVATWSLNGTASTHDTNASFVLYPRPLCATAPGQWLLPYVASHRAPADVPRSVSLALYLDPLSFSSIVPPFFDPKSYPPCSAVHLSLPSSSHLALFPHSCVLFSHHYYSLKISRPKISTK